MTAEVAMLARSPMFAGLGAGDLEVIVGESTGADVRAG